MAINNACLTQTRSNKKLSNSGKTCMAFSKSPNPFPNFFQTADLWGWKGGRSNNCSWKAKPPVSWTLWPRYQTTPTQAAIFNSREWTRIQVHSYCKIKNHWKQEQPSQCEERRTNQFLSKSSFHLWLAVLAPITWFPPLNQFSVDSRNERILSIFYFLSAQPTSAG